METSCIGLRRGVLLKPPPAAHPTQHFHQLYPFILRKSASKKILLYPFNLRESASKKNPASKKNLLQLQMPACCLFVYLCRCTSFVWLLNISVVVMFKFSALGVLFLCPN